MTLWSSAPGEEEESGEIPGALAFNRRVFNRIRTELPHNGSTNPQETLRQV